jgi:hypothetical protein
MPLQQKLLGLLRIAIVVALILGIVAATSISDHETPSQLASIQHYRLVFYNILIRTNADLPSEASAALIIVAMIGSAFIAANIVHSGVLGRQAVMWMVIQTTLIVSLAVHSLLLDLSSLKGRIRNLQISKYCPSRRQLFGTGQNCLLHP